ncbi:MAG: glutamine-hydrolyzing carbamoyl-phosphate synthase small subunit [Alphaproteobacteria bacterium]|nr:glutamine-hydrolyzing carbamoyl-phosphate synthase small subunit [Alphaproteobacteria bacterium]
MSDFSNEKPPRNATAVIVLSNGQVIKGMGIGAPARACGEICFNTSMTGYQEILTDPSYAGQIITFTFPHIGNVGTNKEDIETINPAARGLIVREDITSPSNWRAAKDFDNWLKDNNLPGICGVDTRALTRMIRDSGAPKGVICHAPDGNFDIEALTKEAQDWPGLKGMDLAKEVSCTQSYSWNEALWTRENGYEKQENPSCKVVAVDFGAKRNILRCLAAAGCDVTVVPGNATAQDILAHKPDGVFLSNGPGDPEATGKYAVPMVKELLGKNMPIFGICLGHQILALALGGKTRKMHLGHRGANHPVKDLKTGKVEITSQNHGFEVIAESLPQDVEVSHISLFDGTNEGIALKNKPVFSVQYHPEASPGPLDSHYLFDRFVEMIKKAS